MRRLDDVLVLQQLADALKFPQHCGEAGAHIQNLNREAGACRPKVELPHNGDAITVFGAIAKLPQL